MRQLLRKSNQRRLEQTLEQLLLFAGVTKKTRHRTVNRSSVLMTRMQPWTKNMFSGSIHK